MKKGVVIVLWILGGLGAAFLCLYLINFGIPGLDPSLFDFSDRIGKARVSRDPFLEALSGTFWGLLIACFLGLVALGIINVLWAKFQRYRKTR